MEVIGKIEELGRRVEALKKKGLDMRDGSNKERRAYGFYMGPLYRELVNLFDPNAAWTSSGVHRVPVGKSHFRSLWDTMLEGVYRVCDSTVVSGRVEAHASAKTLSARWAHQVSSDVVETMARSVHKNRTSEHMESFVTLLLSFDSPGFSQSVLREEVLTVPFFSRLAELVETTKTYDTPDAFSAELSKLREEFPLPPEMVHLREKFYPSRGDYRAYVSDADEVRQLTGSLLASVFQPAQDAESVRDGVSRALYPKGKNLIDQSLIVDGFVAVGFSDVSSFTGGYTGTWMGLLAILLALRYQPTLKHLNAVKTVMVHGYPFEFRVADVIQIYLYLSVGLEAIDDSTGEPFTPTGGLLGVSGNSALSLFFYAVEMQWVVRNARAVDSSLYLRCQLGGDDIFLVATHRRPGAAQEAVYEVLQYLRANIGFSREETIREVNPLELGLTGEVLGEFCKKGVLASKTKEGVAVRSLRGYPAPVGLLIPPLEDIERYEVLESVRHLMEDLVASRVLTLEEACSFLGASERRLGYQLSPTSSCLYVVGQESSRGYCIGPDAAELLQQEVSYLQSDGTTSRLSFRECLAFWSKRNRLMSVTARTLSGDAVVVVRTHKDPVATMPGTREGVVQAKHDYLALALYNTIKRYD